MGKSSLKLQNIPSEEHLLTLTQTLKFLFFILGVYFEIELVFDLYLPLSSLLKILHCFFYLHFWYSLISDCFMFSGV